MDLMYQEMYERLKEKYHLVENRGEICIEILGVNVFLINFAIKEHHIVYFIPYMTIRDAIHSAAGIIMSEPNEYTNEELENAKLKFSESAFNLIGLATNIHKTDISLLMRKFSKIAKTEKLEEATKVLELIMDFISVIDYAIYRGQKLISMMMEVVNSGDANKIKELSDKDILPYEILVAKSEDEMKKLIARTKYEAEKLTENSKVDLESKNKIKTDAEPMYDLSKMQVIGEA